MMLTFRQRYPRPWAVEEIPGGFKVGIALAWVYELDGFARSASPNGLAHAEALSIAKAICRLASGQPGTT